MEGNRVEKYQTKTGSTFGRGDDWKTGSTGQTSYHSSHVIKMTIRGKGRGLGIQKRKKKSYLK
jgi:hypothetical protein